MEHMNMDEGTINDDNNICFDDMDVKVGDIVNDVICTKICVISCIFGTKFRRLYPAVNRSKYRCKYESNYNSNINNDDNCDCYLFTNNCGIQREVIRKGWTYIYVDDELTSDIVISSNQSKKVKFLQYLSLIPNYKQYREVIYVDHKFKLESSHIDRLLELKTLPILIRTTPMVKLSVWTEHEISMSQPRYKQFESCTVKFIEDKLQDPDYKYVENIRICNTGLIIYDTYDQRVIKFTNLMYQNLQLVGTPECQVIWAMVCQPYQNIIQTIDFNIVSILWKCP